MLWNRRTCVRACVRTCVSVVCSRLPFQHGGIHCVADTKPRYNIIHRYQNIRTIVLYIKKIYLFVARLIALEAFFQYAPPTFQRRWC